MFLFIYLYIVAINSLRDSVFYNIDCSGSFEQIQVQAQFSQAIFMLQLADDLLMGMPTDDVGYADLLAKRDALRELVQVGEEYYIRGNADSDAALQQEMIDLFDMPATPDGRRVVGGNQYGIIINSKGVAVNQFVNGKFPFYLLQFKTNIFNLKLIFNYKIYIQNQEDGLPEIILNIYKLTRY